MYNRYIPQNDGSYRRNRVQENPPAPPPEQKAPRSAPQVLSQTVPPKPRRKPEPQSPLAFFRQLIPKDLDTEDLIILLLLLLMSGDCKEDQNTALLTLVLYLFL